MMQSALLAVQHSAKAAATCATTTTTTAATTTPPESIKTKENISHAREIQIPRPIGLLLKKPITMEMFPWTKEFQGLCKSSLTPTSSTTLIMLMTFLLSNARKGIELCYKKSLRAAKLKEIIKEALPFFTYLRRFENSEDKKQAQYFETMSDLLAIYVDLELISSKRDVQPQTESISNRISSYIILNLENLTEYMLETFMKVSLISESYNNILDPVFMRIFTRIPANPETEIMFVRYLLVFKLWKRMKSNINDRAKIQSAAMQSLGPVLPEALPKSIVERVLPAQSSDPRMTKSYLRAPIDFRKACAEFLDYVQERRAARRKNAVVADKERNPRLNCSNVIEDVTNKVDRVNSSLNKINKLDSTLESKIDPHANHNNSVGTPKQITNNNINNKKVKNSDILIDLTDDDITKVIKLSKRKKIGWLEDAKKHTEVSTNSSNKITLSAKPKEEDAFASNFTKITITPEIHYDRKAFAASPPVRCVKADATSDESTFESVDISEVKDKKPEVLTTVDDKAAVEQEKTTTTQQSPTAVVQPRLIVSTPTTQGQCKRKSDPIIAPTCVKRNNMSEKEEKPVSKALPRPLVDNNILEKDEDILPAPLTNGISEKENKPIIEVSKSVLVVNKFKKDDQPVPTVLKSPIAKRNEKIDTEPVNKSSVIIDPSVQKDKIKVDVVPPRCKEFQDHKSSQIRDSILVSTKNLEDKVAKVVKQISALRDAYDNDKKAPKKPKDVEEKSAVAAAAAAINNKLLSNTDHVFTEINKSLDREKSMKDEKTVQAKLDVGLKVIRVASEESLRESKLSPTKIKSPLAIDLNNKIDEPFVDAEKYADIVQANDIDGLTLLATISARHVKVKSELDSAAAEYLNEKMIKLEADANPKLHQQEATYGHEFKFDSASIDGSNEHPNVILNGETVRLFQKSPNSNLYIINKAEMEEIKFNYQNTAQQLQQQIKTEFKPDPETAYLHGRDVVGEKKQKSVVVAHTPPPPEPYDHHRYPSYLPPNPYCTYAHVRGAHRHDCHCALFRAVPAYYVPPAGAAATSNIVQSDMAVHESSNSSSGGKRKRDESQDQLEKVMGSAVEQMQKEQQQQQQQNKRATVESRNNVRYGGSSSSSCRLPIKKRYMAEQKLQEEENNQHRRTPVPLAVESVSPRMLLNDSGSDSDIFNFAAANSMMHEKPPQSPSVMLLDLGATVEVTSSTESPTTAAAAAPPQRGRGRPSGSGSSSVPASRRRKSNANDNVGVIVEKKATKKTTVTNGNSSASSNSNSSNSKKLPRASKRAVPVVNYTQLPSDDQASPTSKRKRKKNTR